MIDFEKLGPSFAFIVGGTGVTLLYSFLPMILGTALGCILAASQVLSWPGFRGVSKAYISVFRGTPLLVQLSLVYYATPQLTGYKITAFQAGILAFSLNSAAYIAEIVRAGLQSVDKGQKEAGLSLGLSSVQTLWFILLPQALKNILPALVNEFISLMKESVLISMIGEMDLFRRANLVSAEKYIFFEPLLVVAAIYYGLILVLSAFARLLEKRLNRSD